MKKQSLIIRYLSHFYGEIEDGTNEAWDFGVPFTTCIISLIYWLVFAAMMGSQWNWMLGKITLGSMLVGFFFSAFTGLERKDHRRWALFYGTLGLPGFLPITLLAHGKYVLLGLLRIQDGILWLQDMLSGGLLKKWKARQRRKSWERDAQLKKEAEKVRVGIENLGAYRFPPDTCNECGQFLPEDEIQDDRSQIRHASG